MKKVLFLAPARREFLEEVDFYEHKDEGLGARFLAAVEEAAGVHWHFLTQVRLRRRIHGGSS